MSGRLDLSGKQAIIFGRTIYIVDFGAKPGSSGMAVLAWRPLSEAECIRCQEAGLFDRRELRGFEMLCRDMVRDIDLPASEPEVLPLPPVVKRLGKA